MGLLLMKEKLRSWLHNEVSSKWGEAQELVIWLGYFLWRRSSGTGYIMGLLLYGGEVRNWLYKGVTSYGGESQELCSKRGEITVSSISSRRPDVKGTQAWDNFAFFLPKSNPYMPFVNFRNFFCFFFFDFRQNFDVRTFPRWLSIRGTKFFYGELISSHAEHTWNRFHRMLSMRGNV